MNQLYKPTKKGSFTWLLLCAVFFVLCFSQFSLANTPVVEEFEYKTKEEISLGINNQLEYLAAFNAKNEKEGFSNKNWYVFVVGNDNFDETLVDPQYLHDYLDFRELEGVVPSSIKDITEINDFLNKRNELLKIAGKPVIYYGVANKKAAINVPYFTNSNSSNISETGIADVSSFYNKIENSGANNEASLSIEKFFQSYFTDERASSISRIMSGVEGEAIVVLKYYYALTKSTTEGKASVKWYSIKDYKLSESIEKTFKVTDRDIVAQYKALKRSQPNKDHRLIEAWYNHITGKEIPNTDIIETDACTSLEGIAFENKKQELITAINSKESSTITKVTLASCPDVIAALDYKDQIKGIRELLSITLVENEEEKAILQFIHGIKLTDFEAFFTDLKDRDNLLLDELIADIDNLSADPGDDENFTSLIEEFLRIGNENNGEYLKLERSNFLTALLKSYNKFNTEAKIKAINEMLTFNLDPLEDSFAKFLVENSNRNLILILEAYTHKVVEYSIEVQLATVGESLGAFFAARNNQEVYTSLLDLAFNSSVENKPTNVMINRQIGFNMLAKMFEHLPKNSSIIYDYLTNPDNKNLHDVLLALHLDANREFHTNYEASIKSYYTGIIKMYNQYGDIDARIELAKWALDQESVFNDVEALFMNIFDNILESKNRIEVYKFLSGNEYEYLNKITINGVLSGEDKREITFIKYYIGLINEFGTVEDRYELLQKTIEKGDDWGWFWWHDTENLISTLFTNLSYTDAIFLKGKLAENNYKTFKEIWSILEKENIFATLDADNKRFATFVTSFSKIFTSTKEDMGVNLERYTPYLNENQNYLYNDEASIGQITDTYIPLTRADYANRTGGVNNYKLESSIDKSISGSNIVSVKLRVGNNSIIDDYFEPFEPIVVEFIEDININQDVKFNKGDIVAVPAFYIPWLDGSIDAQQHTKAIWVAVDIAVLVASFAVLVTATTVVGIAAASFEIIFALTDAVINIKRDELVAEFGSEFVDDIEMANLIWGLVNLPVMIRDLPKGIMKIKTSTGKIFSSGVDALSSIRGKVIEIGIDSKKLLSELPNIARNFESISGNELIQITKRFADLEQKMSRRIGTFLGNPTKEFITKYKSVKNILFNLYLKNYPEVLDIVYDYNNIEYNFSKKILDVTFNEETLFKIDSNGAFLELPVTDDIVVVGAYNNEISEFFTVNFIGSDNRQFNNVRFKIVEENGTPKFARVLKSGESNIGELLNYFQSKNPKSYGKLYSNRETVTDAHLINNEEFYAVVLVDNNGVSTKIVGFNEEINSIESLRDQYPDINILKDESADLRLVKYRTSSNGVPTRTAPRKIDGKEVVQYEFLMGEDIVSDINFQMESSRRLTGDRSEIISTSIDDVAQGNNNPTMPSPANDTEILTVNDELSSMLPPDKELVSPIPNGDTVPSPVLMTANERPTLQSSLADDAPVVSSDSSPVNQVETYPEPVDGTIPSPEMTNNGERLREEPPSIDVDYSSSEASTMPPPADDPDFIETIIPSNINDDVPNSSIDEIAQSSLLDESPSSVNSSSTNEIVPPPPSSSFDKDPTYQVTEQPVSSSQNERETIIPVEQPTVMPSDPNYRATEPSITYSQNDGETLILTGQQNGVSSVNNPNNAVTEPPVTYNQNGGETVIPTGQQTGLPPANDPNYRVTEPPVTYNQNGGETIIPAGQQTGVPPANDPNYRLTEPPVTYNQNRGETIIPAGKQTGAPPANNSHYQGTEAPPSGDLNYRSTEPPVTYNQNGGETVIPAGQQTRVPSANNPNNAVTEPPVTFNQNGGETVIPAGQQTRVPSANNPNNAVTEPPVTYNQNSDGTVIPANRNTRPATYAQPTEPAPNNRVSLPEPYDPSPVRETVVPESSNINSSRLTNQTMLPEANSSNFDEPYSGFPQSGEPNSSTIDSDPGTDRSFVIDRGETVPVNDKKETVVKYPTQPNNNPTLSSGVNPPSPTKPPGETVRAGAIVYPKANGSTMPSPVDAQILDADLFNNSREAIPTNIPPPIKKGVEAPENVPKEVKPKPKEEPKPAPN